MVSEPYKASSSNQQSSFRNQTTNNTNQTVQINFSFTNPIKLDRSNYLLWRSQVLVSIRGNRLEDFVTGARLVPNKYLLLTEVDGSTQKIENLNIRSGDHRIRHFLAGYCHH